MKIFFIITIAFSSYAMANSQIKNLQRCINTYAEKNVEEHNAPNEALLAVYNSASAKKSTIEVIEGMAGPKYAAEKIRAVENAPTLGIIFHYSDEVHLIYVSVDFKNGKCQVQEIFDLNTVDVSETGFKPTAANVSKFFLNYTRAQLLNLVGKEANIGDIFDIILDYLQY